MLFLLKYLKNAKWIYTLIADAIIDDVKLPIKL